MTLLNICVITLYYNDLYYSDTSYTECTKGHFKYHFALYVCLIMCIFPYLELIKMESFTKNRK